jgi:hypothetical protein
VAGKNAAPKLKCDGVKENKTSGYLSGGLDHFKSQTILLPVGSRLDGDKSSSKILLL